MEQSRGEQLAQVRHLSQDVPTEHDQSQPLQRHHGLKMANSTRIGNAPTKRYR